MLSVHYLVAVWEFIMLPAHHLPCHLATQVSIHPLLNHSGQGPYLMLACPDAVAIGLPAQPGGGAAEWANTLLGFGHAEIRGPLGQPGQMPAGIPHQPCVLPGLATSARWAQEMLNPFWTVTSGVPARSAIEMYRMVRCGLTDSESKWPCVLSNKLLVLTKCKT
jgi:hypothetical protein